MARTKAKYTSPGKKISASQAKRSSVGKQSQAKNKKGTEKGQKRVMTRKRASVEGEASASVSGVEARESPASPSPPVSPLKETHASPDLGQTTPQKRQLEGPEKSTPPCSSPRKKVLFQDDDETEMPVEQSVAVSASRQWTPDRDRQLSLILRESAHMYDIRSAEYRNQRKKRDFYEAAAKDLNVTRKLLILLSLSCVP